MHCIFLIFIQFLIFQNALSREITSVSKEYDDQTNHGKLNVLNNSLILFENKERSITDIWNHIKNSANTAWQSLRTFVEKTKENIDTWVQHIKIRADTIKETLKEKLTKLRTKIKSIVQNALVIPPSVQKCIKKNTEDFDHILLDLINNVSRCISDKLSSISDLERCQLNTMRNETEYMKEIEKKLNECSENKENVEECLLNKRIVILKEIEAVADKVFGQRFESRNLADDILDDIITCSANGLIEATAVISTEAVSIIQCFVQHAEPESNVLSLKILSE